MFRLAFRNIVRQRLRTAMTLAAIVFGVMALILSGGFVHDVYHQLGEALIHSQSGHIQVAKEGFQERGARSPERYVIEDSEGLRGLLAARPGVEDVMARVNFSGLINNGRSDWAIVGQGVEADKEAVLGSQLKITAGRQLGAADRYGVLLGQGVAQALKLEPGDYVTLLANTLDGALNSLELEVVGVFQSFSADFDLRAVSISLEAAQELLGTAGVNTFVISLRETPLTESTAEALRSGLAGSGFAVLTWRTLNSFYENTVALYERQFGFLQLIILVLVLLGVANSVNMSAFERVGEFGTMMALGNRRGDIRRLVIVENVLLGMIGGGLGVALGGVSALVLSAIGIEMPPPPNANLGYTAHIRLVPSVLASSFSVGLVATVLASLLPAWRVARIQPVDALRRNA
ncbi:MAG TPA: ABC transporter permease [Thauera sp.]|jgi:putative ABC transport system permease protein|uniref:ABC transporter permease n=1 Tax=Thauera sp. TaxID=1905334 RepID=UPI000F97520A|nr:ABC transporter permease [Thauera sp.]MCP5224115.1 ABC transporter permease [Thauera sp.]RTL17347.1 MAG: ABC transporter permease [Rhodocyclaceae bacterium]HRV77123.1 ABC transporter permease [Thauera sp.]